MKLKQLMILLVIIVDYIQIVEILMKWWERKYGLNSGERNNNVYILASAFNDFGVNKTLAEYIMGNFVSKDFPQSEIKRTIHSAYKQVQNFGTKYYEDEERVNEVKSKLRKGIAKGEIKNSIEEETDIEDSVLKNDAAGMHLLHQELIKSLSGEPTVLAAKPQMSLLSKL